MGSFLFADKKGIHVHLCFLPLLRDFTHTMTYNWGGAIVAHTYRKLCRVNLDRRSGISGCITLIQVCNIIRLLTSSLFYIQCSAPFRHDPIGGSEPDLGCSDTTLSVETPALGLTRLADPNRNPSDARPKPFIKYISFINVIVLKSLQKRFHFEASP